MNFDSSLLIDAIKSAREYSGNDFRWESKYPDAYDFRPHAVDFHSGFIDVLHSNDIKGLLAAATNSDEYTLAHCQVRHALPISQDPEQSYMPWHRDTYLDSNGQWVGNQPPVQKLIFYYDERGTAEPRLSIVPNSHRLMFDQPDMDISAYNTFSLFKRTQTIHASNEAALLFNTSLLHHVVPECHPAGSIRVIYSFCTPRQFNEFYSHKREHVLAHERYEGK